jgi:hypothetical protein
VILLSAITWVPGLLLFLFQGSLAGASWLGQNLRVGVAIVAGCAIWIVVISLLSLALSACVRRKVVAQAALLGLVFGGTVLAQMINLVFRTSLGGALSLPASLGTVWSGLYGTQPATLLPPAAGWAGLLVMSLVSLALLYRRLIAYEVAR